MRILIKGGVWKNTEDEILKAAVMKYGKNAWARVASLLNRKSAKQCKARWYEWLDPSIKKTEWSKDEEEKLLHLAKLMPNQWRTIAPIVGRTAAQCMDHYEKLLDQAQDDSAAASSAEAGAADDPRRLRAGEIDPAPETKPARPDPIDMDEDEKEMLSEARARLANTKGKKAKRKLREQTMAESRRLATLQKRRELKAAGIDMKLGGSSNKRRRFIDYAKEIPFQKVPPAGFYDVAGERQTSSQMGLDPLKQGLELARLEGQHKKEEDEKNRKKDQRAIKKLYQENAPLAVAQVAAANDPATLRRRNPLFLPAPQVSENELEEIVKLGEQSMLMGPPVGAPGSGGAATQALVADYAQSQQQRMLSLPTPMRTPLQEDTIMQEARNQRALRNMTSLFDSSNDGDLPELSGGTGFEGAMPRSASAPTPNTLLGSVPPTPSAGAGAGGSSVVNAQALIAGGSSVRHSLTGGSSSASQLVKATPLRDHFGLNPATAAASGDDGFSVSDMGSIAAASMRTDRTRNTFIREQLSSQLKMLPEPEFSYEVALPADSVGVTVEDVDEDGDGVVVEGAIAAAGSARLVEDAADLQARRLQAQQQREAEEFDRRSSVMKRQLPRPTFIPTERLLQPSVSITTAATTTAGADSAGSGKRKRKVQFEGQQQDTAVSTSEEEEQQQLIAASVAVNTEMVRLMRHDEAKFPQRVSAVTKAAATAATEKNNSTNEELISGELDIISKSYLQQAEMLIRAECNASTAAAAANIDMDEFNATWDAVHSKVLFIPNEELVGGGQHGIPRNKRETLDALGTQFDALKAKYAHDAKRAQKLEHKLKVTTQGYQARAEQLQQQFYTAYDICRKTEIEKTCFAGLRDQEGRAAQRRLQQLQKELLEAEQAETRAQQDYANIVAFANELGVLQA